MTIKYSLTKSMINKDTNMSQYLMVQPFHWMNSQNSFYVLENLCLWEYPISHSTVFNRWSLKKLLLTVSQNPLEKTSVRVIFKENVLA